MKVAGYTLGMVATNCYFLQNEANKQAIIVDPADQGAMLYRRCVDQGYTPVACLLTHGHFDHIMGLDGLRAAAREAHPELAIDVTTGEINPEHGVIMPVYLQEADAALIQNPEENLARVFGCGNYASSADVLVKDGQELTLAGLHFRVIHTPGHTPGSCCYYFADEGVLIAGDTLFQCSYGRTDFPGGSMSALVRSITEKLFVLPEETKVYPGHNDTTTIGYEKRYNPLAEEY